MTIWNNAPARAMAEGVTVCAVDRDDAHNVYSIQMTSAWNSSTRYQVTVAIIEDDVLSNCTCPAGRFRQACKHQALARTLLAITGNQ